MKIIKRFIVGIIVLSMIFASTATFASENTDNKSSEDLQIEFDRIFADYAEKLNICDELLKKHEKASLYSAEKKSSIPDLKISDTITRYNENNDVFTLTFYTNGGYSKAAVTSTISKEFINGSYSSGKYKNCKVYAQITIPGTRVYSGGVIGDSIDYTTSGGFVRNRYGNYMSTGTANPSPTKPYISQSSKSTIKVVAYAYATSVEIVNGQAQNIYIQKPFYMTLRWNSNSPASPTVSVTS